MYLHFAHRQHFRQVNSPAQSISSYFLKESRGNSKEKPQAFLSTASQHQALALARRAKSADL